jgi:DinB superfamily
MVSAADVLRRQWRASADRLDRRLGGVADAEFFWEPAGSCWTVRPDPSRAGRYVIDYEEPEPEPPPLTTIAWRLVHLANGNWIYWEYAFGPGERMFPDLVIPHTGNAALRYWHDSREPITAWLEEATDDDLAQSRPSHLGEPRTAGDVMMILVDEQVHHGAEIALLRDLYRSLRDHGG